MSNEINPMAFFQEPSVADLRLLACPGAEELTALIDATIAEVGATSPREMGKVISAIMATHKGRVDGKALSAAVKARLTA